MAESVAVLSDIHGVRPLLDAVLDDPLVRGADRIVVTGDHASGPQPTEVLDRLAGIGHRLTLIRGNADRELVSLARDEAVEIPDEISPWAAAQLRGAHVEFLARLPETVTLDVDGFGPVLFCHATPRSDTEIVLVDSSPERWLQVLAGVADDVRTVVCGHTHMPFVRLVDRRLVVNPGSVGMPYGRAGAHWALLHDGSVTLHRVPVDADAVVRAVVAGSGYPDREEWANYFVRAEAGDLEALRLFTPAEDLDRTREPGAR